MKKNLEIQRESKQIFTEEREFDGRSPRGTRHYMGEWVSIFKVDGKTFYEETLAKKYVKLVQAGHSLKKAKLKLTKLNQKLKDIEKERDRFQNIVNLIE